MAFDNIQYVLLTNPLSRELNLQVHFQSETNCYIRILPEKDRVTNNVFILDTQYAAVIISTSLKP